MLRNESEVVWAVVLVKRGIPILVEAYRDETTAQARAEILREDTNPDYDEVGVFEVEIGIPATDY